MVSTFIGLTISSVSNIKVLSRSNRALSHELIQKLQGSDDAGFAELPDEADRALAVVAEKLETKLSIEYTVNNLIQQATDVDNISRIYHG